MEPTFADIRAKSFVSWTKFGPNSFSQLPEHLLANAVGSPLPLPILFDTVLGLRLFLFLSSFAMSCFNAAVALNVCNQMLEHMFSMFAQILLDELSCPCVPVASDSSITELIFQ